MRVLQLCHKVPFPPSDGGSIAMHQVTSGLLENGYKVKVLALDPSRKNSGQERISEEYYSQTRFESHAVDTRVKPLAAFLNLFTKRSYNLQRFYDRKVEKRLEKILKEETFDIIQLEGLYLTPYIPVIRKNSGASLLYRSHNIEHFIWERMAAACSNPLKKRYLKLLAGRLRKFEMEVIHHVDGLVAISSIDLDFFHKHGFSRPSSVVPAGIPAFNLPDPLPEAEANTVFHLGSMDWRPNQEGVEWFLEKVWPLVVKENPELKFYLAGKRTPQRFYRYESDSVKVAGQVPDALEFILSKKVMVVPLLSGGGMRVKIVEGMAAKKVIVSTVVGAEGIDCRHKENILVGNNAEEMARNILLCFRQPKLAEKIGENAREFALKHYAMQPIIERLMKFYSGFYSE